MDNTPDTEFEFKDKIRVAFKKYRDSSHVDFIDYLFDNYSVKEKGTLSSSDALQEAVQWCDKKIIEYAKKAKKSDGDVLIYFGRLSTANDCKLFLLSLQQREGKDECPKCGRIGGKHFAVCDYVASDSSDEGAAVVSLPSASCNAIEQLIGWMKEQKEKCIEEYTKSRGDSLAVTMISTENIIWGIALEKAQSLLSTSGDGNTIEK